MASRSPQSGQSLQGDRLRFSVSATGGLLWKRTVVSQEWLAAKLEMKSAANVSQQLSRLDVKAAIKKMPEELKPFLEEADATNS